MASETYAGYLFRVGQSDDAVVVDLALGVSVHVDDELAMIRDAPSLDGRTFRKDPIGAVEKLLDVLSAISASVHPVSVSFRKSIRN